MRYPFLFLFVLFLFLACQDAPKPTTTPIAELSESKDSSFDSFINKFSTDSVFQKSRIVFPLKTTVYDMDAQQDKIIFVSQKDCAIMDFRQKKSTGQSDQWVQKTILHADSSKAHIEIRGIDNGISVDCKFEKKNGNWYLLEVNDHST